MSKGLGKVWQHMDMSKQNDIGIHTRVDITYLLLKPHNPIIKLCSIVIDSKFALF